MTLPTDLYGLRNPKLLSVTLPVATHQTSKCAKKSNGGVKVTLNNHNQEEKGKTTTKKISER